MLTNVLHLNKSYQMSVQNDNKLNVQRTVTHPNCFMKSHNAHTSAFCYLNYKMANTASGLISMI